MIKKWLNRAADRGFGLLTAMLMRRAVAPLLRINEHALHESGLSRRAVADFLATPLGTEPGEFFPRHKHAGVGAPASSLDGQPDARAGPQRRGRRRRRATSSKSTLDLAKEKS
jgi:hypothetical protein